MKQATQAVRDLARLLLELEASRTEDVAAEVNSALNALGKLHSYLSKMVGIAGFQALLARALVLATAEVGWLRTVRVQEDATLTGFAEAAQQQHDKDIVPASIALLSQLFGLLFVFIGEALTLRLVQDIWPELQETTGNSGEEKTPA